MRGIAAMMVVVYHAAISAGLAADREGADGSFLDAGVDIFFIISGFVMIVATSGRTLSAWQFMSARLKRIVPLYWIALLVTLIIGTASREIDFPPATEILQAYLFIPYVNQSGVIAPFLTAGWTLSYELFFYAVFALLIAVAPWRRAALILGTFIMLIALRPIIGDTSPSAFRFTSPLLLEFVAGMYLALSFKWWEKTTAPIATILIGLGIAFGVYAALELPSLPRFIAQGGPSIMIVAGALLLEPIIKDNWRSVRFLGHASYSIYLFHSLFIFTPALVGMSLSNGHVWAALMILTGTSGGLLAYQFIERPLVKRLNRHKTQLATIQTGHSG